jgi:sulfite reductase alpha subunit-like flavoprotein
MNRRGCLKRVGVLSTALILALYGSRSDAADPQPVTVLVTYHSATGNTEKMAQAVAEGAKAVSGTSVVLKRIGEVIGDDLLSADAVIVGSPVYVGNMSGQVKTFFDNWGSSSVLEPQPERCATRSERRSRLAGESPAAKKSRYLPSSRLCLSTR